MGGGEKTYGSGPEYTPGAYGGGVETEDRGLFGHRHAQQNPHHPPPPANVSYASGGHGYGGGPPQPDEEVFKIVCEANPSFYLTERDGKPVMAPGSESNRNQQWVKDARYSAKKDAEGFPAFSLINKASGLALFHDKDKVSLKPYDPNSHTESFLWSRSADVGHGYQCLRPFSNVHLNLDAYRGDKEHGGVKDGTEVILHKWNKQENQKWKVLPITSVGSYASQAQSYGGRETVKISCEARPDFYITVRGDTVVLAAAEDSDPRQEWFKDSSLAANMKDESGSPAFVLVNKASHKALQHGDKEFDKVRLTSLHGNNADDSVLWTASADVGKGYRCLRSARNIELNLDASHGDDKHGGVHDGTELILYKWLKRENQKWRLTYV